MPHIPAMLEESLSFFRGREIKTFFEGTLGAGGFARAFLSEHAEIETYYACDQDPSAIELAKENLKVWEGTVEFIHGNFRDLDKHLESRGVKQVDGFFLT